MEGQIAAKKLTLEDVRAKLARARAKQSESKTTAISDQISDLQAQQKLDVDREKSLLIEKKRAAAEVEEFSTALAETRQSQAMLAAAGEDPAAMIADIEGSLSLAKDRERGVNDQVAKLVTGRAIRDGEILRLNEEIRVISTAKAVQARATNGYFQRDVYENLPACRDDIRKLFEEAERLPAKLSSFEDRNAQALIIDEFAAHIKVWRHDRGHELTEPEESITYRMMGSVLKLIKVYPVPYLDSISPRAQPSQFRTWAEYLVDSKRQLLNFFNPVPGVPKIRFGVVRSAKPESPQPTKPQPAKVVVQRQLEPIVKTESMEKQLSRLVMESGVLKKTTGKRVAVIAGGAEKNEQIRALIEAVFGFKRVRWYDRDTGQLFESIKNGGIDLLLAFPNWHGGYKQYVDYAKEKGIGHCIVEAQNKSMIIQTVGKHFGVDIKVE